MPTTPTPPIDPFPEQGDFEARYNWFARRLEGRSREDCILISARTALRLFPNLTFVLPKEIHSEEAKNNAKKVVFPLTRCDALSAAASLAPASERAVFSAAADAASAAAAVAAYTASDTSAAAAAADAASAAAYAAAYAADAASAASAAAYAARTATRAATRADAAFVADLARLDGSHAARERLAASSLWLNEGGAPEEILNNWNAFSAKLRALGDDWDVWAEWYGGWESDFLPRKDFFDGESLSFPAFPGVLQGAQNGRYLFGLSTARALKLWHDVALLPNDLWQGEPAALNAEFKRLVEEARGEEAEWDQAEWDEAEWDQEEENDENSDPPVIPTPKPSAIEPVWEDGRLILPAIPAPSDGSVENVLAALHALKEDFAELVEDAQGEANIDSRAITYLSRLASRIPNQAPTNLELHRIAQNESALLSYGKTVTDEWPDFLAVRYHALALQFTRVMAQFPNWREFKRIATQADLTKEQVEEAPQFAREFAEALRDTTLDDVVDPAISQALESLVALADSGEGEGIILGKEMLAVDLLNSLETIWIRLMEAVVASMKRAEKFVVKVSKKFISSLGQGMLTAVQIEGFRAGFLIYEWISNEIKSIVGLEKGISILHLLKRLIETYPEQFGWLENIIKLLP